MSPEENHDNKQGLEHLPYKDRLRGVGIFQPGDEKASERNYSTFQYLKGLKKGWRETFYKGMLQHKNEWLQV